MDTLLKAKTLHSQAIAVDAHLDLAAEIFYRRQAGARQIMNQFYLKHWREAGFKLIISSIYVEADYPSTCMRQALEQIVALKEDIRQSEGQIRLVTSGSDLEEVLQSDQVGILMSFEGLEAIENNGELLNAFYDLGVRGAGLVWSRRNFVADGCISETPDQGVKGGLTRFGVEVVRRMDDLGMFFDVSHLNDEGFWDLMKFSAGPVIASHSDCRGIFGTNRNLSDEQIKALAQRDGVIGINAIKHILGVEKEEDRITKLCDHIDHIVRLVGVDYVGFGFDLCDSCMDCLRKVGDPECDYDAVNDHSEAILITAELLKRGYAEDDIKKIQGDNFLRVLRQVLK